MTSRRGEACASAFLHSPAARVAQTSTAKCKAPAVAVRASPPRRAAVVDLLCTSGGACLQASQGQI
jgi:hypothetical protein